jgi:O-antigen biosynthesis protein WbqP
MCKTKVKKIILKTTDVTLAILVFPIMLSTILLASLIILILDFQSPIFLQKRVGMRGKAFLIFKLRTMKAQQVDLPTHLVSASEVTKFGRFLRKYKIDEFPQIFNVLLGDMSFVGPRPCLLSQTELIKYRSEYGLLDVLPGITGIAQVNGIDMSDPRRLVSSEGNFYSSLDLQTYFLTIFATFSKRSLSDRLR